MKRLVLVVILATLTMICLSPLVNAAPRPGGGRPSPPRPSMPRPVAPTHSPMPKAPPKALVKTGGVPKPTTVKTMPTKKLPGKTTHVSDPRRTSAKAPGSTGVKKTTRPLPGKDTRVSDSRRNPGKERLPRPRVDRDYHNKHGARFSHGIYYRGRHHGHWTRRCFCPRWGCWTFYCPAVCGWYYWHPGQVCYYPVSYLAVCPPPMVVNAEAAAQAIPEAASTVPVESSQPPTVPDVPAQIDE